MTITSGGVSADHDAEAALSLLWRDIIRRVQGMMHPHHHMHEPGGKDQVRMPLSAIVDVEYPTSPVTGELLGRVDDHWENVTVAGLATPHGAYLRVPLPGTTTPPTVEPGPENLSGAARTITKVKFRSNGAVSATATGGSCAIGAGGGSDTDTGTTTWADGAALSVTISSCGADATYLLVDWNFS